MNGLIDKRALVSTDLLYPSTAFAFGIYHNTILHSPVVSIAFASETVVGWQWKSEARNGAGPTKADPTPYVSCEAQYLECFMS